jgi:branched-chain amino acid transport system ATP-binding protein
MTTTPATVDTQREPALELHAITAGYGRTIVLRDVSLSVPPGTVTALLGPNGAGKTTLLKIAAGLLRPASGSIDLDGTDVTRRAAHARAERGLCLIPEGRGIFRNLTVRDNLRVQLPPWRRREAVDAGLEAFPVLADRLDQVAGSLSGGQQQMLAVARAYLSKPSVVLLDEVSMGLAPRIVDEIFDSLRLLAASGVALLVVEQYVQRALDLADAAIVLNRGVVSYTGPAAAVDEAVLMSSYLGVNGSPATAPAPAPRDETP